VHAQLEERAAGEGLLGHEMGDACLLWGQPREKLGTARGRTEAAAASL
jgi:hypothetical protein